MTLGPDDVRLATVLREIAEALQGLDDPQARLRRALDLARALVPCHHCALLLGVGDAPETVAPSRTEPGHDAFVERLTRTWRRLRDIREADPAASSEPEISVPIVGFDAAVIGVLGFSGPPGTVYDEQHLRALSVVAAQIGAFQSAVGLHADLQRRMDESTRLGESLGLLVAVVSHELRNPLNVIDLALGAVVPELGETSHASALRRALRNTQRAIHIVHDLLDASQARSSGVLSIIRRRIDLRTLLGDVVDDARAANPSRTIELKLDREHELVVNWDADRIGQATTNFLANALRYGDPQRAVSVVATRDAGEVAIQVHNHGNAISEELLPQIFDPFRRGKPERAKGGGLGLGLYIVDQIARAHGGSVSVASTTEAGTTFTLQLPVGP